MSRFVDSLANVRSDRFVLLGARAHCPHCGSNTRVVALGVPRAHQWRDEDSANSWYQATAPAVLFHISYLAPAPSAAIVARAAGYKPLVTGAAEDTLWCNHCASCQRPLSDDELHCEPGGAFMPLSSAGVRFELELIRIPFTAQAGGYAPEPPFYPEVPG